MPQPYVALGDSYAAGVGGGARRNACWRAAEGYPVLVARSLGLDLAYQACLGATTRDVERHQVSALGPGTSHVSLTVGGNDIGFVPVLVECAKPAWMVDTDPVIDAALATLRAELPSRLSALLAQVTEAAPDARLVVTAYPLLFSGEDCNALTFFSPHEMRRIGEGVDGLAGVVATAAGAAGAQVVDPREAFGGHAVCDREEWVSGVSWPLEESFHPNALGHEAYARLVTEAFGEPGAGAGETARPEREVVVVDGPAVPGEAPTFALPDLLSQQSLEGARRHGLDPERVADLARRADRTATGADADAARAELHALDRLVRERLGT
ncbi:SGNH/GDSL hydrolase family protein [Knoellia sp. CPCC 206450]|uniref:SGNH/GDSL hydrolase family protein n=1 Tax=Knoellia tibetensis TaxID=3404798 RepID=UPI003B430DBA